MANLDLVSIDPLRLSALSFIVNLCLMSTEGGWRVFYVFLRGLKCFPVMAQIITSHRGVVCQPMWRASLWLGVPWLIPVLFGLLGAASAALQEAFVSAPFCSAVVHFRECQFEQGVWRGSLPINI